MLYFPQLGGNLSYGAGKGNFLISIGLHAGCDRDVDSRGWVQQLSAVLISALLLSVVASAERLPMRVYSTADGLPSNQVMCNYSDSHGFLWFCTSEGLSRFDGYTFTNYGVEDGLPDRVVLSFLETKNGAYWVGTTRGVALFNPKPGAKAPMFTAYGENEIGKAVDLQEDAHGTVWIATDEGLFNLIPSSRTWSLRRSDLALQTGTLPDGFLTDRQGNLWISLYRTDGPVELWRRNPEGKVDVLTDPFLSNHCRVTSMTEDRHGRIWLSTYQGLALLVRDPQPGGRIIQHVYSDRRWQTAEAGSVFQASDGRLWANAGGTQEIVTDSNGRIELHMLDPKGLGFNMEDRAGNLWISGKKMGRTGFVRYGREDGLKTEDVRSIFEGVDGALYVVTGVHSRYIHRLDGNHFTSVAPKAPGHEGDWDWGGWGWGQTHFQDHLGQWWAATGYGVLRYPKVKFEDLGTATPQFITPTRDVFRLYEDSIGDVWISAWFGAGRWERSTGRFQPMFDVVPTSFREDRTGNVWVGHWGSGLSRCSKGHEQWIIPAKGSTAGSVLSLFLDHAGRMWAGTTRAGLVRIDEPGAEHPTLRFYSMKEGLSSDDVRAITEDHFGRIYFWTGRGVDSLNPETGAVRHYTEADGLVPSGADHNVAFCDRAGRLWFGFEGLSRLEPTPDRLSPPPTIRITKVRIRGARYPVSELGETNLSGLELQPDENQVQIEFASLNFAAGELIKYQYKLEGAENDWSVPSDLRIVNYPSIPPGRYRFLVRAVNVDGVFSPTTATVSWRVLPPIWARWWFVSIACTVLLCGAFLAYRYRVQHLLELERMRTRIATDLHDDIGSSLTQIAIMSEVARKQGHDGSTSEPLARIANLSRELVDSMSDIVWAINPKRDHLGDLAQRMRRFVNDFLENADVEVIFRSPEEWAETSLTADVRREVFLIFKESLNNVVRHSRCDRVEVSLQVGGGELWVEVRDDGLGFQPDETDGRGHGLASMRARAERLGGSLHIESQPRRGTTLRLVVPVGRSFGVRNPGSRTTIGRKP